MPEPVSGGGIDPVDAELDGVMDRLDRVVVVLPAPPELPAAAPDRPRAEADTGDLEAGRAEGGRLQLRLLHVLLLLGWRSRPGRSARPSPVRRSADRCARSPRRLHGR